MTKLRLFDIPVSKTNIKPTNNNSISLEDEANGEVEIEKEIVLYAKVTDFAVLEKAASKEEQEQWSIDFHSNNKKARIRVRKSTIGEETTYTQTTKVLVEKSESDSEPPAYSELTIPTTEEGFNQFRELTNRGMKKTRFTLPFTANEVEYEFEVDCFPNDNGDFNEWVKIDIEVDPNKEMPVDVTSYLPSEFTEVLDSRNKDEATKKAISDLYTNVFTQSKSSPQPVEANKDENAPSKKQGADAFHSALKASLGQDS